MCFHLSLLPFEGERGDIRHRLRFREATRAGFLSGVAVEDARDTPFVLYYPVTVPGFRAVLQKFVNVRRFKYVGYRFLTVRVRIIGYNVWAKRVLMGIDRFGRNRSKAYHVINEFMLGIRLEDRGTMLRILMFRLRHDSYIVSPYASPVQVSDGRVKHVGAYANAINGSNTSGLGLLLRVSNELNALVFCVTRQAREGDVTCEAHPVDVRRLGAMLTISFGITVVRTINVGPSKDAIRLSIIGTCGQVKVTLHRANGIGHGRRDVNADSLRGGHILSDRIFK